VAVEVGWFICPTLASFRVLILGLYSGMICIAFLRVVVKISSRFVFFSLYIDEVVKMVMGSNKSWDLYKGKGFVQKGIAQR
jgi:hypothetical protein